MENFTLVTKGPIGRYWQIKDTGNIKFETNVNGFSQATWTLQREIGATWEDVGLNYMVYIYSGRGDVAWYGRLESIEPQWQRPTSAISCAAVGYWSSTEDRNFAGILGSSVTPEAMLAALVTGGYLPQLSSSVSLLVTGLTGRNYETANGGTTYMKVSDVIMDVCRLGTSTSGQRVIPYVSFDDQRMLSTKAVKNAPTSPRYYLSRNSTKSINLRRALSSVATRIILQYKDLNDSLQTITVDSATSQGIGGLGYIFSGTTVTPFVREVVVDISNSGPRDATDATNIANILLDWLSRVRNDSQDVVIDSEYSVYDAGINQEVPLWQIHAGEWMQFRDLIVRPIDGGSGISAADAALQSAFFISKTSYDTVSRELTITPEGGATLEDLINRIVPKTEALTEWHYKIDNKGTAFPTQDLTQGRRFYRTDLGIEFYHENNFSGPAADWYYSGRGVTDGFSEADNTSTMGNTQNGLTWNPLQGTWGIISNKAYSVTDAGGDTVFVDSKIVNPTLQVQVSGTINSGSVFRIPQLCFYGLDINNYMSVYLQSGQVLLRKKDGGTGTPLIGTTQTTVDGQTYTLTVVCLYPNIYVYVDSVLKITYTLASTETKFAAYTQCGFSIFKAGAPATVARFNSFKVRQKF